MKNKTKKRKAALHYVIRVVAMYPPVRLPYNAYTLSITHKQSSNQVVATYELDDVTHGERRTAKKNLLQMFLMGLGEMK